MSDVIVIGVAGGTGSGKTTLVKALMNRFGDNISVLSHAQILKSVPKFPCSALLF